MEKFILLFRGSDVYKPDQSPEALQALTQKMMNWLGGLIEKGAHVASEKLKRNGKLVKADKTVTDTAFGTVKDVLGGCTIVQTNDLEEAVAIALACPILETDATIEIRPILSL